MEKALKIKEDKMKELAGYETCCLKRRSYPNGNGYYWVKWKGATEFKYLGTQDDPVVAKILAAKYHQAAIKAINKNTKLVKDFLENYHEIDYESINALLPKVYQNSKVVQSIAPNEKARRWKEQMEAYKATFEPYHPEELVVPTADGSYVRSKSEGLIYNLLLSLGITFVYELPIKTNIRTFYPDFTILSEIDYKSVIIIEHQGKMNDLYYREKHNQRFYDYLRCGYTQGVNIFFTYDFIDGGFDFLPVYEILAARIRPDLKIPIDCS